MRDLGPRAYKTVHYFLVSRTLGATTRMYLVINILQIFILKSMGIPFGVTVMIILLLILLYTFEGGGRPSFIRIPCRPLFMLLGLVVSIFAILSLNITTSEAWQTLASKGLTKKSIMGCIFYSFLEAGARWCLYHHHHDWNGSRDDAKKHQCTYLGGSQKTWLLWLPYY